MIIRCMCFFFFLNDTATTEIYTLSLHDALPIYYAFPIGVGLDATGQLNGAAGQYNTIGSNHITGADRKSTRLNSSHPSISYAVFCLKKKNIQSHFLTFFHANPATEDKVLTIISL